MSTMSEELRVITDVKVTAHKIIKHPVNLRSAFLQ